MMTNYDVMKMIRDSFHTCCEECGFDEDDVELFIEPEMKVWGMAGCVREHGAATKYWVQINFCWMVRQPEEIDETMRHEFGHLVDYRKGIFRGHSASWAQNTRALGVAPRTKKKRDYKAKPVWSR